MDMDIRCPKLMFRTPIIQRFVYGNKAKFITSIEALLTNLDCFVKYIVRAL